METPSDKTLTSSGSTFGEEKMVVDLSFDVVNPFDWPLRRKIKQTLPLFYVAVICALNAVCYGPSEQAGTAYFGVSGGTYLLGNTGLLLSIAFFPMILAPLSELFGRRPVFYYSLAVYTLLYIPASLTHNFTGFAITRAAMGASNSVANSMVAGTLNDMFRNDQRGVVLNVFVLMIFIGQGVGPVMSGWVCERMDYRWLWGIQGVMTIFGFAFYISIAEETRVDVLRTKALKRARPDVEVEKINLWPLIKVSVVRPFLYLCTEPIVIGLSAWVGFAWGVIFLFTSSVLVVFEQYGFSVGQSSTFLVTCLIGGIIALSLSFHQERLYLAASARSASGRAPPEARLYYPCAGGIILAVGMWMFAWTGRPEIHWIVPAIALVIVNTGIYLIYLGVFSYLADAYERFSSSAQASQSFVRNVTGATFPLFARIMYARLGPPVATSILAALATVLAVVPFLLLKYGSKLRERSYASKALLEEAALQAEKEKIAVDAGSGNAV